MKQEEVNILIDKYLEGKTTPEEERRLALELSRSDAPRQWQAIRLMLGDLALGEALYDRTLVQRKKHGLMQKVNWAVAASVVALLSWGIYCYMDFSNQQNVAFMYVNGQKITDEKQVLTQSTAAVTEIFNLSQTPDELVELFNIE